MHTIRLRGPWQLQLGNKPEANVGFDWLRQLSEVWERTQSAVSSQEVQLARIFNAPTGIEANDRLELVLVGLQQGKVVLNDQTVCECCLAEERIPILSHLQPRNQLTISWPSGSTLPAFDSAELPTVRLEITPASADHS